MFQNLPVLDKRAQERTWAQAAAVASLPADELAQWHLNSSIDRIYFGVGYDLVSWTFKDHAPVIKESFKVMEAKVYPQGLSYSLVGQDFDLAVSHAPVLIPDTKFFVWVPYFNEIRCKPTEQGSYLTLSLCVSQPSNPQKTRINGHRYLTTRKSFNREWSTETKNNTF
jgi:hypothetical protein